MKKLIKNLIIVIVFLMAVASGNSFAQIEKGNWMVEGNIGNFSFSKYKNQSESGGSVTSKSETLGASFGAYPRGAYFVVNNLAIGSTLGLSFNYSKSTYFDATGIKSSDYKSLNGYVDIVPFIRYYFPTKKTGKLRFYGQIGGGVEVEYLYVYESTNYTITGDISSKYKQKYTKPYIYANAEVLVGLNYFVSKQIAINTSLGYQYTNSFYTYNYSNTNNVGVTTTSPDQKSDYKSHRLNWMLGFTYTIPGKKNKTSATVE